MTEKQWTACVVGNVIGSALLGVSFVVFAEDYGLMSRLAWIVPGGLTCGVLVTLAVQVYVRD